MKKIVNVLQITQLHSQRCEWWHQQCADIQQRDFMALVEENHWRNFQLWHEEDEARREDIGAEGVYRAKRAIDRFNQERNDFIEKIDVFLFEALSPAEDVPTNSETPGMIIDRLSILALKHYHMQEESVRSSASALHREKCLTKLAVIKQQLTDLARALDELIVEVQAKQRSFSLYYQFKMYNDPELNPKLYNRE